MDEGAMAMEEITAEEFWDDLLRDDVPMGERQLPDCFDVVPERIKPGEFTARDVADQKGIRHASAIEWCLKLERAGKIECVGRRYAMDTAGIRRPTRAWRGKDS